MSEQDVVRIIKNKDQKAFSYLYDHYAHLLYAVIVKIAGSGPACEELLKRTFVGIWDKLDQVDDVKMRFVPWLLEIARSAAMEHNTAAIAALQLEVHNNSMGNYTIQLADQSSPSGREAAIVLHLVYKHGCSIEEIAQSLQMPVMDVRQNLRSALLQLRKDERFR